MMDCVRSGFAVRRDTLGLALALVLVMCCVFSGDALAQTTGTPRDDSSLGLTFQWPEAGLAEPIKVVVLLTVLALVPAIVVATTSFTRIVIVLSMMRHAFGMQDTPPNIVLISLALFLALFTMAPALEQINTAAYRPLIENRISLDTAVGEGVKPLREFMVRQTREKDLALILEVARVPTPDSIDQVQTLHIIPAFLISELKTAFQIGFVIFLPFLLLDLVVASILMSMGMLMVPPTIISLPLKLLLFVLIDGWALTIRALLGSFH
jgi:flagellar biosynthesis protein FliP